MYHQNKYLSNETFIILTTQISLEEYLNTPSAENLLALGDNRAQVIVESLARNSPTDSQDADPNTTYRGMASAFKVARLYTTVTACHVDGCDAHVKSAVEQTVGKLTTSHNLGKRFTLGECIYTERVGIPSLSIVYSDVLLRPLCEAGEVNTLINEMLVHIGLIKVSHQVFVIVNTFS